MHIFGRGEMGLGGVPGGGEGVDDERGGAVYVGVGGEAPEAEADGGVGLGGCLGAPNWTGKEQ